MRMRRPESLKRSEDGTGNRRADRRSGKEYVLVGHGEESFGLKCLSPAETG